MLETTYRNKMVLVTGHTGFKGTWLCSWLLSLGAEVHGVSKDIPTQPSMFEELGLIGNVKHHILDIRNADELAALMVRIRPDFVFHLAAQPIVSVSYKDPFQTFETNVMGTLNVLQGIRALDRPVAAVMITSDKCYENVEWTWGYRENDRLGGKDPYSASKGAAELVIHSFCYSYFKGQHDKKIISVRAGNVIGGGDWAPDRIVPDAIRAWAANKPVVIRRPKATRPWQHVLEPLSGYLRAGQVLHSKPELSGEAYNFGPASEQNFAVIDLLNVMGKQWFGKDCGDMINVETTEMFHEAGLLKLNCDKAFHELQWRSALDFNETTSFTTEWYAEFYQRRSKKMLEFTQEQINRYSTIAKEKGIAWAW